MYVSGYVTSPARASTLYGSLRFGLARPLVHQMAAHPLADWLSLLLCPAYACIGWELCSAGNAVTVGFLLLLAVPPVE